MIILDLRTVNIIGMNKIADSGLVYLSRLNKLTYINFSKIN